MDSGAMARKVEELLREHFSPTLTMDQINTGNLDLGKEQDEFVYALWETLGIDDAEADGAAQGKLIELQNACAETFGNSSNKGQLIEYFLAIAYERHWQ